MKFHINDKSGAHEFTPEAVTHPDGSESMMEMTLSHRFLDVNLDILNRLGFDKAEAVESLELAKNWQAQPTARFSIDVFLTLLEIAAIRLDDPNIGLRMGHCFRISTYGQTGAIYGFCENLHQVINMNSLYQCLAIDAGKVVYDQDATHHYMLFQPYYTDQIAYRHITDLIMGAYGTAYRWLSWASGEELSGVAFPYATPEDTKIYETFFQCPLQFDPKANSAALIFSETAMNQKLTTYDAEKLARARAQLDKLLNIDKAADSLNIAVEAAIRGAMAAGQVTTQTVAKRMGRDWFDLQLELKQSGFSFRDRVTQVRQNLFIELYESGHSFAEISQALAYNDQPSFNRAFKRWYDTSPSKWAEAQNSPPPK